MKSIFDESFHYIPSAQTDVRKTFARIRREQRKILTDEFSAEIRRGGIDGLIRSLAEKNRSLAGKKDVVVHRF